MTMGEATPGILESANMLAAQAEEVLGTIHRLTDPSISEKHPQVAEVVASLGIAAACLSKAAVSLETMTDNLQTPQGEFVAPVLGLLLQRESGQREAPQPADTGEIVSGTNAADNHTGLTDPIRWAYSEDNSDKPDAITATTPSADSEAEPVVMIPPEASATDADPSVELGEDSTSESEREDPVNGGVDPTQEAVITEQLPTPQPAPQAQEVNPRPRATRNTWRESVAVPITQPVKIEPKSKRKATASEADEGASTDSQPIKLDSSAITINGERFDISFEDFTLLSQISQAKRPLAALEVCHAVLNGERVTKRQVNTVADGLYLLYKWGLLNEEVDAEGMHLYQLNMSAANTIASKTSLEIGNQTIVFDEEDLRIIEELFGHKGLFFLDLATNLGSKNTEKRIALKRIIEKYFYNCGVIEMDQETLRNGTMVSLTTKARAAYKKFKAKLSDEQAPATPPEPTTESETQPESREEIDDTLVMPILKPGWESTHMHTHVIRIANLKEVNRATISLLQAEDAVAPTTIKIKTNNRVSINGHERSLTGNTLELLNHLLLNIGESVDGMSLWKAGFSLMNVPGEQESPSASKLHDIQYTANAAALRLNDIFGDFIEVTGRDQPLSLAREFIIEDPRPL